MKTVKTIIIILFSLLLIFFNNEKLTAQVQDPLIYKLMDLEKKIINGQPKIYSHDPIHNSNYININKPSGSSGRVAKVPIRNLADDRPEFNLFGFHFGFTEAVHEKLIQEALRKSGILSANENYQDEKVRNYIRGVFWNDDPEMLWLNGSYDDNYFNIFSNPGIANWCRIAKDLTFGKLTKENTGYLTRRSLYGDLIFIHSMAQKDGIPALTTKTLILKWAKFTYKVAIGDIQLNIKLCEVEEITGLFSDYPTKDVSSLFNKVNSDKIDVKKIALGSLLHLIQDSYILSHTQRENTPELYAGKIEMFLSYINQLKKVHAICDSSKKIEDLPGFNASVDRCSTIIKFYKDGTKWENGVEKYLNEIFELVNNSQDSGPGKEFEKQ